ncbi:MAG: HD domain-containing protein [Desulfurococcus sp.]|nr:HD domain-containing protein [Desulfurococcus sp.]
MNVRLILNLRYIPRSGWVMRGVPPSIAESVADHSFLVSLISMDIARKLSLRGFQLDYTRVLSMSLIHDAAEAVTGDVVRGVKENFKEGFSALELKAMEELGLKEYTPLLSELERAESLEALVVKVSDDIATVLEGLRLIETGYRGVKEIVESTRRHLYELIRKQADEKLRGILESIVEEYLAQFT